MAVVMGIVYLIDGENPSDPDAMKRPACSPKPRFQYRATNDPLEMLKQTVAANDALLAKQKELKSWLAVLAAKAQADKSAAHRSTSHAKGR